MVRQSRGRRWARQGLNLWRAGGWGRVLLGLVPLLVMLPHALGIVQYGTVTRLEQQVHDVMLMHGRAPATLDERIVSSMSTSKACSNMAAGPGRAACWPA